MKYCVLRMLLCIFCDLTSCDTQAIITRFPIIASHVYYYAVPSIESSLEIHEQTTTVQQANTPLPPVIVRISRVYCCVVVTDKVKEANGCVLIHCLAGISRSATVAIAYLMFHLSLSFDDAYKSVAYIILYLYQHMF